MFSDLREAIFYGPPKFKIFSFILLILICVWFIVWALITYHMSQNPVSKEEESKLGPRLDIKIFPLALSKNIYCLMIQNLNKNSVPIVNCIINFYFPRYIKDIKQDILLNNGSGAQIQSLTIVSKKYNYEDQPVETVMSKNFSLVARKVKINNKETNINEAIFACSRWPEETSFSAEITIENNMGNKSMVPVVQRNLNKIGTYEGLFFYEIKGRKLSKRINGNM